MGHLVRKVAARALLAAGLVLASLAVEGRAADERADALRVIGAWAEDDFAVPATVDLAPPLRARVEAMASAHRARIAARATTWFNELAAIGDTGRTPRVRLLMTRYFNELVSWQIDRFDDADDARLLRALNDPGLCAAPSIRSAFGRWVVMLQRLPEADREAAIRAQTALLERWGRPRADLPPRPDEPWMSTALAALKRLRDLDPPAAEPPAPPVLMLALAAYKPGELGKAERCALAAWTLQREPLRQAPAAEQARQMRFALAWDATQDLSLKDPATPGDEYPALARIFLVQGKVRVKGLVNASGTGLEAPVVVAREISVFGLGKVRPAAFESLLDEASLRRAATAKQAGRPPGQTVTLDFVWRLE